MEHPDPDLQKAVYAPDLTLDIAYCLRPHFLSEMDKKFSIEDRRNGKDSLYQPDVSIFKGYALSSAVHKKEKEMVRYYASVIKRAKEYNKDLHAGDLYFWLRPVFIRKGKILITFPWYDTYREAKVLLEALLSSSEGWIFDDMDQGWHFSVFADKEKFYFLEGEPEDKKYGPSISVDRKTFSSMISQVMIRTERQLEMFTKEAGKDYWSKRGK